MFVSVQKAANGEPLSVYPGGMISEVTDQLQEVSQTGPFTLREALCNLMGSQV